mmetsp:Transcript_6878/g.12003  ORF Transcript_6878/g.12003 Transcript_6878/m.12003 type:complete len:207 (+) Transcript_6878:736-1356(+)
MVGAPPAPLSSTIATPATAIIAGSNRFTLNVASCFASAALCTLHNSAMAATKTQCILQITHDLDAVVVNNPRVCPKYPKATHEPQMRACLSVSPSILILFKELKANGASAAAETPKRLSAYKEESTPGSAMTNLAAAKLDAHKAHRMIMTDLQAADSNHPETSDASCDDSSDSTSDTSLLVAIFILNDSKEVEDFRDDGSISAGAI